MGPVRVAATGTAEIELKRLFEDPADRAELEYFGPLTHY